MQRIAFCWIAPVIADLVRAIYRAARQRHLSMCEETRHEIRGYLANITTRCIHDFCFCHPAKSFRSAAVRTSSREEAIAVFFLV